MSALPRIVLQNSQNAVGSISRNLTKRAAIADRCRLQAIAEVARQFIADYVVPQMIVRSTRIRAGKIVFSDAKGVLQHYPPVSGHSSGCLGMSEKCQEGTHAPRQNQRLYSIT
jgi:hypothetical protein